MLYRYVLSRIKPLKQSSFCGSAEISH